jgi:hypothetical protein
VKREPNITRMDYGRTHGWWVRFQRGTGKERVVYSKQFSDGVCGGKRAALKKAIAWRNRTARLVPGNARRLHVMAGYGYVKRQELWRRAEYHPVWLAWLRVKGGRCLQTSRSVRLWGERGAKRGCEQWLKEQRSRLGLRASGARRRAA